MWRAAGLALMCFALSGLTKAETLRAFSVGTEGTLASNDPNVNIPFPSADNAYCSATNGCGTIPSGGQTAYQWTAGDYVLSDVFTNTGLTSVTDLIADWTYQDFLSSAASETWFVYVNGFAIAYVPIAGCGECGNDFTITGGIDFPSIAPVSGGYQVELVLQNTVFNGEGSVAWLDGGTTGLSGTNGQTIVPEPDSVALFGSGLVLLTGLLRRKSR